MGHKPLLDPGPPKASLSSVEAGVGPGAGVLEGSDQECGSPKGDN
jgi:hypothetical protein